MSEASPIPSLPLLELYGDPALNEFFSRAAQVAAWLDVERALADAEAEHGVIPPEAARDIAAAAVPERIDLARLADRTRIVGYPILPLLEQVIDGAPDSVARYVHWGATTQDIMDTADALRLTSALALIDARLRALGDEIARLTGEHRSTLMAGRTHGQQAVPTTLGAKTATWLGEVDRHRDRLAAARDRAATVELFGAAGTGAALGPASAPVRRGIARRLGLAAHDVPGHTARDDLAEVGFVLAAICATTGKIAREIAELARTEIGEVREADGPLRGASSTMPQKRNPIDSEGIVGLTLLAVHQVPVLLSAMQAVHERATGEWQAEWDVIPLLFGLTGGALRTSIGLLRGLAVSADRMRRNLRLDGGRIMCESVMMAAAPVIGRSRAHEVVYAAASHAQDGTSLGDVLRRTLDPSLRASIDLDAALTPSRYLGEAESIADAAVRAWANRRGAA